VDLEAVLTIPSAAPREQFVKAFCDRVTGRPGTPANFLKHLDTRSLQDFVDFD
jgi:hypothetical protein